MIDKNRVNLKSGYFRIDKTVKNRPLSSLIGIEYLWQALIIFYNVRVSSSIFDNLRMRLTVPEDCRRCQMQSQTKPKIKSQTKFQTEHESDPTEPV